LLKSISKYPNSETVVSTIARTSSSTPTSAITANAVPPSALISLATASAALAFKSATATSAPSLANLSEVARPMPDPPPAISAFLPARRLIHTLLMTYFRFHILHTNQRYRRLGHERVDNTLA